MCCAVLRDRPECGKLSLGDHLITPIQRIPRYIMLLRDLKKRSEGGHPDHQPISKSLGDMEVIAMLVNNRPVIVCFGFAHTDGLSLPFRPTDERGVHVLQRM
jgi:hypothetical protein